MKKYILSLAIVLSMFTPRLLIAQTIPVDTDTIGSILSANGCIFKGNAGGNTFFEECGGKLYKSVPENPYNAICWDGVFLPGRTLPGPTYASTCVFDTHTNPEPLCSYGSNLEECKKALDQSSSVNNVATPAPTLFSTVASPIPVATVVTPAPVPVTVSVATPTVVSDTTPTQTSQIESLKKQIIALQNQIKKLKSCPVIRKATSSKRVR